MPGKIDQDVDAIGADAIGGRRVAHPDNVSPGSGAGLQALRDVVGLLHRGIAYHLDGAGIVRGQQRLGEIGDRVLAEIGRHIADSQPTARVAIDLVTKHGGILVPTSEATVAFGERRERNVGIVIAQKEEVGETPAMIRIECECMLESRRRLGEPALVAERDAEIGIRIGIAGLQANRRLAGRDGLAEVPDQEQGVPEIGEGGGIGRVEAGRLAQQRDALVDLAARDEDGAEIGENIAVLGPAAGSRAQDFARRAEIAARLQCHAEAVGGSDQVGSDGQRLPIGLDRARGVAHAKAREPAQLVHIRVVGAGLERAAQRNFGFRPALLNDTAAAEQHERGPRSRVALDEPGDEDIGFRPGAIGQHQGRKIGGRVSEIGAGGEHLAIATGRLLALSGRGERVGEIEPGLVTLRLERERTPMAGNGLVQPAAATQQVAEVHLQTRRERASGRAHGGRRLRQRRAAHRRAGYCRD